MKKLLLLLLLPLQIVAQVYQQNLPRSTPEAEGISSVGILQFLDAAANSKHEFHSLMIVRHGKVVAEGWWNPYRPDLKHTMYSVSKSFTATAIGFAVAEKRLTVEDKVISFFPDQVPTEVSPNLAELRIKDLLSMSVGHEKEPSAIIALSDNWVKDFLAHPIPYKPGTKFLYNSPATYMLSAIVQKVTGQRVIEYLKPRLFEPLGIEGIDWEIDPKGINVGGWGLRLKTEDMAKFGQLFLQKGKWNGKQILPTSWVEEASTKKIMQNPDATPEQLAASDWLQGYCYQMWRSRHNSYRGDGANGQYILVLPEHDAVIAITAETPDMQDEINLVWKYLLPAFQPKALPPNVTLSDYLKNRLNNLVLPIPTSLAAPTNTINNINHKTFVIAEKGLQSVSLDFDNQICRLSLQTDSVMYQIPFGLGKWEYSETKRLGPYLVARGRNNRVGLPPFKVAGSYAWKNDKTIVFTLRYIESPHTETITCNFDNNEVTVDFEDAFNRNQKKTPLKGVLK